MEVISFAQEHKGVLLNRVANLLRAGGMVVGPTDTVYGIFCDATNEKAVEKMFAVKQRPKEKILPIFVANIAEARRYAYISDVKVKFLERVWPGAVTAVFHHKEKLPRVLTGGLGTIGIRIPDHPFLLELLSCVAFPLAQTSANISAFPPAKNAAETFSYWKEKKIAPDLILDGGECTASPSVVVDCTGAKPAIVRAGIFRKEELERLFSGV